MKPFFVGLHLGSSKPISLELFLRPLVDDLKDLLKNGLKLVTGEMHTIKLDMMILDAPSRAYLKRIIGHSGYFSCERCTEEGVYLIQPAKGQKAKKKNAVKKNNGKKKKVNNNENQHRGHVCLVGTDADLRTDKTFREQRNEEHHTGIIILRFIVRCLYLYLVTI